MSIIITRPWALYNEIDEYAADWLENLIRLGVIAPGIVDRRSIEDIRPDELGEFRQCHFFAGIGVWSYALRRAGISDDTAVWTGSCPCQPFSAAGKGGGVADERHLWPAWHHLIRHRRPALIYGEQVASKDGLGWLDLVCADMEGEGYAIWAADTCSAGSGAPHIRQRLRFVSYDPESPPSWLEHSSIDGPQGRIPGRAYSERGDLDRSVGRDGAVVDMADTDGRHTGAERQQRGREQRQQQEYGSAVIGMANADMQQQQSTRDATRISDNGRSSTALRMGDTIGGYVQEQIGGTQRRDGSTTTYASATLDRPGPTNGFWRDADWLFCRDGKWRPVVAASQQMVDGTSSDLGYGGTFPLVQGSAFKEDSGHPIYAGKSRQGMLKGYGNAIDAEATVDFISATRDALRDGTNFVSCQSPLELVKVRKRDMEDLL